MINVNDYKANFFSQNGEDGILAYLLTQIEQEHFVIEFGAADGYFYSNTAALWATGEYDALLIESDSTLYDQLRIATEPFKRVTAKCALVESIDNHTERVADICSIDIDGDDYQVAERMNVQHKIVVVEHNATVPPHIGMINYPGSGMGSAALSVKQLMEGKGYTYVAGTKTNSFFLFGDHRDKYVTDLETLFDRSALNYVVTAYDGQYEIVGDLGYSINKPANMLLQRYHGEKVRHYDDWTKEYMRQMNHLDQAVGA
jgi:hypothetical protein